MPISEKINQHLDNIRTLRADSGLFTASARGVETGYDKAWLRDNFYTVLAFEEAGEYQTAHDTWRAILDIFLTHEDKIDWAAKHRPFETWQYIHARYHPETFGEFWEEWGNKQHDAIGSILFKLADLQLRGVGVIETDADRRIIQRLIDYLGSVEYWHDPDNGVWEEGEEVHASSVGAVLAGLEKVKNLPFVDVPHSLIEKGGATLNELLPRESEEKFVDLALLSLVWPYEIVSPEMAVQITDNVRYHLERNKGVIRYKHDRYYNKNQDGYSEEAEWTFGFPWLAIIYHERGEKELAREYLEKARQTIDDKGQIPELYYSQSDKPNENSPLGWSESLYVIAENRIAN